MIAKIVTCENSSFLLVSVDEQTALSLALYLVGNPEDMICRDEAHVLASLFWDLNSKDIL